jgi:hypothetical protein
MTSTLTVSNITRTFILIVLFQSFSFPVVSVAAVNVIARSTSDPVLQQQINATVTNVSCHGASDGVIDLNVNENITAKYEWSDGQLSEDVWGLSPGTYMVTVTASNGSSAELTFMIADAPALVIEPVISLNCISGGTIDLKLSGGNGNYSFEWSGGERTAFISNLIPGEYSVKAEDSYGCSVTGNYKIELPASESIDAIIQQPGCISPGKGSIDLIVTSLALPVKYQWSNGATVEDLHDVTPGDYIVTVTDHNNCKVSKGFAIASNEFSEVYSKMELGFTSVSSSCVESEDGGIDLNITGGIEPFTYEWSNGNIAEDLLLVKGGNYSVVVTDGNGCMITGEASVESPAILAAHLTADYSKNINSCEITAIVTGGISPYHFQWSDGTAAEKIDIPLGASYTLTVTDAYGCQTSLNTEINVNDQVATIRKF